LTTAVEKGRHASDRGQQDEQPPSTEGNPDISLDVNGIVFYGSDLPYEAGIKQVICAVKEGIISDLGPAATDPNCRWNFLAPHIHATMTGRPHKKSIPYKLLVIKRLMIRGMREVAAPTARM
jgi:hypothetical protein